MADINAFYNDLKSIKDRHKCEIYIFGSRIWGTPKWNSDVDIAISYDRPSDYADICEEIENLNYPYIYDFYNIVLSDNAALKERIRNDGKKI